MILQVYLFWSRTYLHSLKAFWYFCFQSRFYMLNSGQECVSILRRSFVVFDFSADSLMLKWLKTFRDSIHALPAWRGRWKPWKRLLSYLVCFLPVTCLKISSLYCKIYRWVIGQIHTECRVCYAFKKNLIRNMYQQFWLLSEAFIWPYSWTDKKSIK